ncbi:MAG: bifunctional hydroxymethylpyrimidine kinase/phosphomethylpyrimidine kinase [Methanocellales archaeon]|nr:bifunctional hydroxymethylpyrimidine kinase/phosphomethylpyrimidine kinase [Methanocellales archaeon]MDD3291982.1 bifunctional hydroxymethylpyrimidine kinase/phosphomethylpyrimidine kinase [Methanocellales archaeon]MDD5235878.1 bifunctional hydroxymethylpyrimidine kinase/phosphomethylpyrimidine kinase [Methanocellales archaeon]MDD5485463.1 bifunctional hydroxymethylpyrimidine kinase/phosphomethylpyrimidine kinase [Methanocellales archaeon]
MVDMRCIISIAGSDSGGGAGIQADLKTFAALDVHGTCAITAITAQNTCGVQKVHGLPPDVVVDQMDSIVKDFNVDYAKTGMLHSAEIVNAVAQQIRKHKIPLVVDPVMTAEAGGSLLRRNAISSLVEELFPLATVVTPNAFEAGVIADMEVTDRESAKRAAIKIHDLGAKAVIVTGGHLDGTDVLYDGAFKLMEGGLIDGGAHGTGCTYSAALAVYLAKAFDLKNAAAKAKEFVLASISSRVGVGGGSSIVNPLGFIRDSAERYSVLKDVRNAVSLLEKCEGFSKLIPEVGSNIGMAIPGASSVNDVAAVRGRIVRMDGARAAGDVDFGASSHVARFILEAMQFDEEFRGGMNIKYSPDILARCKKLGFSVTSFDRGEEPKGMETMEWGAHTAIKKFGFVPDVIYDLGSVGKEPMIRVLGCSATDAAQKVIKIAKR